jgi:DNA-binding transcriptional ArsR family regulator
LRTDWLEVIGDENNLKILMELDHGNPLTLYSLSRKIGAYPRTTKGRLEILMKCGVVEQEALGGVQTYRLKPAALPDEVKGFLMWLKAQTSGTNSL